MIWALMDSSARTNDTIARSSISYNVASKGSRAVVGTSKPLVSVVIPTYNRAALLDEALSSAGAQEGAGTLFDEEIVVVDDASSDEMPAVVRRHPPVRYIRHATNRGGSAARNTGMAATSGSLIAFLDDDLWLPNKLVL